MNILLIGNGYWGERYVQTIAGMPEITLEVCTYDYAEKIKSGKFAAAIICTPAETHFKITKDCLLSGLNVLVEKPFTMNYHDALELRRLGDEMKKVILVGHIYMYHKDVIDIRNRIESGELGNILSITSKRMSSYKNSDALWELAVHDIYIINNILNGIIHVKNISGDKTHRYIEYRCGYTCITLEVSSVSKEKIREFVVVGTKKTIMFDDTARYDGVSPLELQCKHFYDCIVNSIEPTISVSSACETVKTLEEIKEDQL